MKRATVSAEDERSPSASSDDVQEAGGRKLIVTPDGAEWAPRPRVENAMVKALARAFRWRRMLDGACMRRWMTWLGPRPSRAA